MITTKKYSSSLIKDLLENDRWNFWTSDWGKCIIVQWDSKVNHKFFFDEVKKKLGIKTSEPMFFERALSSKPTQYIATKNGLKKITN